MTHPPLSPDGRWWWDGHAWQPVPDIAHPAAPTPGSAPFAAAPTGGRWERGLRLRRDRWDNLRSSPALGGLPVLSFAGLELYLLPLLGIAVGMGAFDVSQRP